jgi:glycosyltransferase involved in cell wall biosynthesis
VVDVLTQKISAARALLERHGKGKGVSVILLWTVAIIGLGLVLVNGSEMMVGIRTLLALRSIDEARSPLDGPPAALSIIVAARNEEKHLEGALRSLLNQHYTNLEVIVVNDRSTDGTGAIVSRLATEYPHLRVVNVTKVPPGWLGKNFALQTGYAHSRGTYLLFTDADIYFDPSVAGRAINHFERSSLDHLTLLPDFRPPPRAFAARSFNLFFTFGFLLFTRAWRARHTGSPQYVGVGAFNLVRRSAYEAMGTHQAIALRPDDDMKLAKMMKARGFRADVLLGSGLVGVEFYTSLAEIILGFTKNFFAGLDYQVGRVAWAGLAVFGVFIWPVIAAFSFSGPLQWANLVLLLLVTVQMAALARRTGQRARYAFGFPLSALLFIYILVRSTAVTLGSGGIRWRETFYSLKELRQNEL